MFVFKIFLLNYLKCLIIMNMVSGRPINEITETRDTPETQIPADFSDSDIDGLKPSELQKATCTVTSGNVRASAEAFTTRELKGVCGSTEMLEGFADLENNLKKELENILKLVKDLHTHFVGQYIEEPSLDESSIKPVTSANTPAVTPATLNFQSIPIGNRVQKLSELHKTYYLTPKLKSLSPKAGSLTNKNLKVYTYNWRMENFTQNIKSAKSLSVESPIFSIRGKAFKIKAYFQHLHRDYLFLQLEDYSAVPQLSSGNSIILDMGGMFKEIESDNFKYKMSILDQNKKHSSDLVSQEFDNYDTGFSIPNSALIDSPFIKDNSLLIQLFLYFK